MRYVVGSVFLCYPVQHTAASVVVEVNVDIGQRYTVGVQETFKQQIILDRVNLRDAQAVSHGTARRRTTSRPHAHSQFLTCSSDIILHDEEVARETHRFHDVQLKLDAFVRFVVKRSSISFACSFISQFGEIVSFEFNAVEFVKTAQFLNLFHPLLVAHHHLAVLIAGKLFKQILFRVLLSVTLFRAELFRYGKVRHDGRMVDGVGFHLVAYLAGSFESFG